MTKKITNLFVDENKNTITWLYDGNVISKKFKGELFAYSIDELDEVLILADSDFDGPNNLFIYKCDGTLRLNPNMPKLSKPVNGIYSIWFIKGVLKQEVILLSDKYSPYDTSCTFNLIDGLFSNFHPSK